MMSRISAMNKRVGVHRMPERDLMRALESEPNTPEINTIPTLDLNLMRGSERDRSTFVDQLMAAGSTSGFFYLVNHGINTQMVLREAMRFFQLSPEEKEAVHANKRGGLRGYTQLKNERDWREQLHFGSQSNPWPDRIADPAYFELEADNQWPSSLEYEWRAIVESYMHASQVLGEELMDCLAIGLRLDCDYFERQMAPRPFMLTKMMHYWCHDSGSQSGVGPHCDWSWLTILLQDQTGGLQRMNSEGIWIEVEPKEGTLLVNIGEILEMISDGALKAAPHRVVCPSETTTRLSIATFISPALDAEIQPLPLTSAKTFKPVPNDEQHVHRVYRPGQPWNPFIFGESEWTRKLQGKWCYSSDCCGVY